MPSWWTDKEVFEFTMLLDATLERVGPTPQFKALLREWRPLLDALEKPKKAELSVALPHGQSA